MSQKRIITKVRKKTKLSVEALDLQRFAEFGRLSASLIHEISNPLSAALIHLEHMDYKESYSLRETRRSLKKLEQYIKAARHQLTKQGPKSSFYLDSQIKDVKRLVLPLSKTAGVRLTLDKSPNYRLKGDSIKFQQILVNLIVNAIEAYRNDRYPGLNKEVKVAISAGEQDVIIEVVDWGEGINPAQLSKLFKPFYTTKQVGHGLGIGLVIVKQYVTENFNGSIQVISSARLGTRFIIKLPALSKIQ